jgi:peptidoglycan lytic transglycosylase G
VTRPLRITAAAGLIGLTLLAGVAFQALRPPSSSAAEIVVEIPRGTALPRVAAQLEAAGVIRSRLAFAWLARLRGQAGALRAGEYALAPNLTATRVLERLASGSVMTHRLVLPEGLRLEEIAQRLEAAGLGCAEEFVRVARDPASAAAFGVEGDSLEGYLFPETYDLARGIPVADTAHMMVDHFLSVWRSLEPAAKARGLSMHDVVVLASLIEKETGAPEERPLIAAVFLNRLARGMRLETDPAVIYGIPDFDGNLRRVHLQDPANPYNTYLYPGLPPGPIANPGAASLSAVVEPADADYLYFVAKNDGTHQFSRSYGDHVRAVNRFQRGGR